MLIIQFIDLENINNKNNMEDLNNMNNIINNFQLKKIYIENNKDHKNKINLLLKELEKHDKNELICCLNVNQIIVNDKINLLENKYKKLKTNKILFSRDILNINVSDNCFIGYSEKIITFYKKMCEKYNCSYLLFNEIIYKYYQYEKNSLIIDNENQFFFNINDNNINLIEIKDNQISVKKNKPIIIYYQINKNIINQLNNILKQLNLPAIKDYKEYKIPSIKNGQNMITFIIYSHYIISLFIFISVFLTNKLSYLIIILVLNIFIYVHWHILGDCIFTIWENSLQKLFSIDFKFKEQDLERSNIKRTLRNYLGIDPKWSDYVINIMPFIISLICIYKIYYYHIKNNKIKTKK